MEIVALIVVRLSHDKFRPFRNSTFYVRDQTLEGVEPMGRGRQKAKATKVARKLKYYSPETDYAALERELAATSARSGSSSYDDEDYSDLAAKYNDDFDDDDDTFDPGRS